VAAVSVLALAEPAPPVVSDLLSLVSNCVLGFDGGSLSYPLAAASHQERQRGNGQKD
jgi:hypothetical protein